jgi:hypothetical protein
LFRPEQVQVPQPGYLLLALVIEHIAGGSYYDAAAEVFARQVKQTGSSDLTRCRGPQPSGTCRVANGERTICTYRFAAEE